MAGYAQDPFRFLRSRADLWKRSKDVREKGPQSRKNRMWFCSVHGCSVSIVSRSFHRCDLGTRCSMQNLLRFFVALRHLLPWISGTIILSPRCQCNSRCNPVRRLQKTSESIPDD